MGTSKYMAAAIFDFDAPLPRQLYWDASFLVHATYPAGRYHRECYGFLDRLSDAGNTLSYVSTLVLDEVVFTLIQLKVAEDHPERGFWDIYRESPQIIKPYLGELRVLVDCLFSDPRIQVVGTEPGSMSVALDYMGSYSLLPRDALHLTTMGHCGIDSMVTTDDDFLPVDDLRIYTCNPRILSQK
jgi:predicted nucleic acid-binding protein